MASFIRAYATDELAALEGFDGTDDSRTRKLAVCGKLLVRIIGVRTYRIKEGLFGL